jgi:hypothetical protein
MAQGGAACWQGARRCGGWPGGGPELLVAGGVLAAAGSGDADTCDNEGGSTRKLGPL